ncbi:hypothetical protein UFOVP505_9 [uncultured Caudovirales phage]|uniref:Uncharacterized protein n=1 Tax=uncultured Caudovirales phage TaxID=2100421 RepID=A0A6J5MPK7_9CAUD|nr:hypothetical protein UFOVP505_9 [uncultured Caudovirales phage]
MLTIKIKNITGSFNKADYHFELWVNDTMQFVGRVKHFRRARGYAALMIEAAKIVAENGNPGPDDAL